MVKNVNFPKVKQTKEAMSNVVLTMTNILLSQNLEYFLVCDIFCNNCHKTFIGFLDGNFQFSHHNHPRMFRVRSKIFGLGLEPEFWIALKCEVDLSAYQHQMF